MINIIFLGAPGSGKGTQAALLAKDLNIPNISTGEILRKEVEQNSEIGKLAKSYMSTGQLVPDQIIIDIIKKCLAQTDCKDGFILDGFPRNLSQAQKLDEMLNQIDKKINLVFNIEVADEIIIKRISGRFSCRNCGAVYNRFFNPPKKSNICDQCGSNNFENRNDDKEETVLSRLKIYKENNKKLVEFYQRKHLIYFINGLKTVPLVNSDINEIIKKFN